MQASLIQEQFWLIDQINPNTAYNLPLVYQIEGNLDELRFINAIEDEINSNSIYALIPEYKNKGLNLTQSKNKFKVIVENISTSNDYNEELIERAKIEVNKYISISKGELIRAKLFKFSATNFGLVIVIHHFATDWKSKELLINNISARYNGQKVTGIDNYMEFAEWQLNWINTSDFQRQLNNSNKFINPDYACPDYPANRKKTQTTRKNTGIVEDVIASDTLSIINTIAKQNNVSPYVVILSSYYFILSYITKSENFTVGIPFTNRLNEIWQDTQGPFVTILPITIENIVSYNFSELVKQVRMKMLFAHRSQGIPVEQLAKHYGVKRYPNQNVFYQYGFTFEELIPLELNNLSTNPMSIGRGAPQLDNYLFLWKNENKLNYRFEYDTDILNKSMVMQMSQLFKKSFIQIYKHPEYKLSSLNFNLAGNLNNNTTVNITGTFTTEPLEKGLSYWFSKMIFPAKINFVGFNQVFQQLLNPNSEFNTAKNAINIILWRIEDLFFNTGADKSNSKTELLQELKESLLTHSKTNPENNLMVVSCPPSDKYTGNTEYIQFSERFENELFNLSLDVNNLMFIGRADFMEGYRLNDYYEPVGEEQGNIPYKINFFASAATLIARKIHATLTPPVKAIILDCDNTLWKGVVGEDGISGIEFGEQELKLQKFLIEQNNKGVLLCLCSKNNENDIWEVFEKNDKMLLKKEHISFARINWDPKSKNIISLSNEINISPDSMVFIDDNPLECEEVKANIPAVITIQKRIATNNIDYLINSWIFDRNKVTEEDTKRALMYKIEAERVNLKSKLKSYKEFINELQIKIDIKSAGSAEITRISQLTFRTNQFNFTTRRRTETEIKSLVNNPDYSVAGVHLKDKYGDYGIIGALICNEKAESINVDTFLLSCRALGKGVEHAMIAHIAEIAKQKNKKSIEIPFTKSEKNSVGENFLNTNFSGYKLKINQNDSYKVPVGVAAALKFDPDSIQNREDSTENNRKISYSPDIIQRNNLFAEIIDNYSNIDAIVEKIYGIDPAKAQPLPNKKESKKSLMEAEILNIWRDVLDNPEVKASDNFFDAGGDSILIPNIIIRLKNELDISLNVVDIFQYPTVNLLTGYIFNSGEENRIATVDNQNKSAKDPQSESRNERSSNDIAIIGLTGRFPGANNIDEFWQRIKNGEETITHYSRNELEKKGVAKELLDDPNYVYAIGSIPTADKFDASFFGFTPREADFMDPQHRVFLESCHEALETAGYSSDTGNSSIGVFAGSGPDNYLLKNLFQHTDTLRNIGEFQTIISNGKDFLTTHVSYKLNLNGPSINIQTACSTSLVAVHYACNSLRNRETDIALAGGVFIHTPREVGYMYEQGNIFSPKGQCRPFDKDADGMLFGEGVGVVVLKRYEDAVKDNDTIWGVIKGSAVNNDGAVKVGFTAPGVAGQSGVIAKAQQFAGVKPSDISYVEAHGTGTNLGDPIEIKALTSVFRKETPDKQFCAIGSVKANIGHLDVAAGVTGLIKTTLALKHKQIPPSINFNEPNPQLQINNSPFYINTKLKEWETTDNKPRIAGVSSFGIGGTNAHCIIQEAPEIKSEQGNKKYHIIPLSAKTEAALKVMQTNLSAFLIKNECNLPDVAFTMLAGRKRFKYRSTVICSSQGEAIEKIADAPVKTKRVTNPRIVFLFTGQGNQYSRMAEGLYREFPLFREILDKAFEIAETEYNLKLKEILFAEEYKNEINNTGYAQPALFVVQYATAKLLQSFDVVPGALIGHSIGEITAASISGLLSFEDALKLVIVRGRLMQAQKHGAMLSIQLPAEKVKEILPENIDFALQNAPNFSVVSGDIDAIAGFKNKLETDYPEIMISQLNTSHAFHSRMMDPALEEFKKEIADIAFNNIEIPFVSNTTGTWVNKQTVGNTGYWVNHIRSTVNFVDGINTLLEENNTIFIEVGPGVSLTMLLSQFENENQKITSLPTIRHPRKRADDVEFFLEALSGLWDYGADHLFDNWYKGEKRKRIPLPTYPFERKKHWIDPVVPFSYHLKTQNSYSPLQQDNDAVISGQAEQLHETTSIGHNRPDIKSAYFPPANETEKKLVNIWQDLLGFESIGVDDDFFELGGHSLLASSLLIRIKKEFRINIELRHLGSDSFSVKKLADLITNNAEVKEMAKPKYSIIVKKTNEITDREWSTYVENFNAIFNRNYSKEDFIRKYTETPLGFSFHSLVYFDTNFVGAQSHMVELFDYKTEVIRIACGVDLFIKEEYRKSFTLLSDLWESANPVLMEHNVKALFSNPLPDLIEYNEAAQTGFRIIARLNSFVLPLTVKVIHPRLSFLDWFYRPLLQMFLTAQSWNKTPLHKNKKLFRAHEYYSPYNYKTVQEEFGELKFSWLWSKIKHLKIIIINDNFKTKGDIYTATKQLIKKHGKEAKAITYITANKLALPYTILNKRELFIGKLLSDDINSDEFFDINNWEFKRGFFD